MHCILLQDLKVEHCIGGEYNFFIFNYNYKIFKCLSFRGVLPFAQRKKLWEKYKAKSRKHRPSTVLSSDISYGTHVCMKNSPVYQPGAIGKYFSRISQVI